jgi:hypothetical protein
LINIAKPSMKIPGKMVRGRTSDVNGRKREKIMIIQITNKMHPRIPRSNCIRLKEIHHRGTRKP